MKKEHGPKFIDLVGKRYGKLTVIEFMGQDGNGKSLWKCQCVCGQQKIATTDKLRSGRVISCGCAAHERRSRSKTTHGMYGSRLYHIWSNMKQRCKNPLNISFKYYGERGIRVCEEWDKFKPFMEWSLKNAYADNLSLDRIDINGNYTPENCRWVSVKEQANNKSNNVTMELNGQIMTVAEASRITGVNYFSLLSRVKRKKAKERGQHENGRKSSNR